MREPPPGPPDEAPQPGPEGPPQTPPPPQPQRGGGSLPLGIIIGVLFFAALVGLNTLLAQVAPWFLGSYLVGPIVYIAVAGFVMARARTARFGAGLLIAVGVSILLGAGVCVALIAGIGRSA